MAKSKVLTSIAVALSLLVGGASYALRTKHSTPGAVVVRFEALPLAFEDYRGEERWFDEGTYTVLRADTSTLRYYVDDLGYSVFLFVAYFGEQTYGEQIHSPRNCLPGGGWTILSLDRVPIEIPGRPSVVSNRLLIEYEGRREVMYYFFLTRVGSVASEYRLKLMLAQSALTFKPRDAIFVRVTVPIGPDGAAAADRRAARFLSESMALLSAGLPFQ